MLLGLVTSFAQVDIKSLFFSRDWEITSWMIKDEVFYTHHYTV